MEFLSKAAHLFPLMVEEADAKNSDQTLSGRESQVGLIPLLTCLPTPNGWVSKYEIPRWERLQNYLKGIFYTKNTKHILKIASAILSKMQSQPEAGGGLRNIVSSKEIRTNVLSKFFHLCLPLDFILDI